MASKRRRERDRPKAANDASYNPNKRVLLSYDSDEGPIEDEALVQVPQGHPQAEADLTNYKIVEYLDDEEEEEEMKEKSKDQGPKDKSKQAVVHKQADAVRATEEPTSKVMKAKWSRAVHKNEATGQWPALGSLTYQWDEEYDNDDEEMEQLSGSDDEAMAYLRAVRLERQAMPEVFTAIARVEDEDNYTNGVGDSRGFLIDGGYVGRSVVGADNPRTYMDPQEAFTTALKKRFLAQRKQMQSAAGMEGLASLDADHPTTFTPNSNKPYAQWLRHLKNTVPQPAQVRLLSQESVFGLLALTQKHYLARGKHISAKTSVWIWSLLARLHDVGTMNNDEVYQVREFGKDAMLVQISFYNPAAAAQIAGGGADGESERVVHETRRSTPEQTNHIGIDEAEIPLDLDECDEDSEKGSEARIVDTSAKQNTLATLEMILAIVGDVFGQRDLLDFRRPWEVEE